MHGRKFLVREVLFGSDGANLYLRVDFRPGAEPDVAGAEARLRGAAAEWRQRNGAW